MATRLPKKFQKSLLKSSFSSDLFQLSSAVQDRQEEVCLPACVRLTAAVSPIKGNPLG